jgi:hypothetical protein
LQHAVVGWTRGHYQAGSIRLGFVDPPCVAKCTTDTDEVGIAKALP